jgi:hypothetical protein
MAETDDKAGGLFFDSPRRWEAASGHYQPLAEWALGSGESVVSFPRFITELLTFPPRLTRAADFLWSVFSTVQGCGKRRGFNAAPDARPTTATLSRPKEQ